MGTETLTSYDVVRRDDGVVICSFEMPDAGRALLYRNGDELTFSKVFADEIVGTPTLFTQMLERAGYRVSLLSDIVPPSA